MAARTTTSQTMSLEDFAGDNAGRNSSNHLSNNVPPPPDESTEVRQNILNDDELTALHGHRDDGSSSSAGSIPPLASREVSSASEDDSSEAMQNHTIKVVGDKNFRYLPYLMGLVMNQYLRGGKTAYGSIPPLARREDLSASEDDSSAVSIDHSLTLARARGVPTAAAADKNDDDDDKKKGDPPRYIYLFHCKTHRLKAVRNHLLKKNL